MGSGASAGLAAATAAASDRDLKAALADLTPEAKAKLKAALEAPAPEEKKPDAPALEEKKPDASGFATKGNPLGEMTDAEVVDAAVTPTDQLKGIYERIKPNLEFFGMTGNEFLLAGHHGTAKLVKKEPLAIKVGVDAPDGKLYPYDKDGETTIHEHIAAGVKDASLTVLAFGSFTCAFTQMKLQELFTLVKPHVDAGRIFMTQIYVGEAHAVDGWSYPEGMSEAGPWGPKVPRYKYAQTLEDKKKICVDWVAQRKETFALLPNLPILVDGGSTDKSTLYAGPVELAYEARTCRIVMLDKDKKVVFCTGAGPDQYNMKEVTAFIQSKFPAS